MDFPWYIFSTCKFKIFFTSGKSYWIMIFLLHVFGFLLKEWNIHRNWIIFPQSANLSSLILFIFFKNSTWFLFLSFHSFFLTIVSLISIDFFPSNMCCAVQSYFNCVRLLWAEAHQAPLSMRFSKQEYWSGLPHPSPSF